MVAQRGERFREPPRMTASAVIGGGWIRGKPTAVVNRDYGAYALVLITRGAGWFEVAGGPRRAVAAGDALLVFPGLRHGYGPAQHGDWDECWFGGRGPMFRLLESECIITRQEPLLSPGLDPALIAAVEALSEDLAATGPAAEGWLATRLAALFADVRWRHERRHGGLPDADMVSVARAALDAALDAPVDLHRLARRLACDYDRLRRVFRRELGVAPHRYRTLRRIERAKAMLADGASLADTAAALGWCDQFYFARQFRSVTGVNPGAWRRTYRGNGL